MVSPMTEPKEPNAEEPGPPSPEPDQTKKARKITQAPGEIGGPEGPEPTCYGDWERNGRVSDF
jgi:hypothetical protein